MKQLVVALIGALMMILLAIAWGERDSEWTLYQRAYFDLAQRRATQSDWYRSQRIEIRQISIAPLNRVDRCTTCHLGVTDPNMVDAPEPFRMHSAILESHPPERFGCTVCHRGEGHAVTTLAAHGQSPDSTARMLRGDYAQASCYECHAENTLPLDATREIIAGQIAINQMRCLRCHQIDGMGESEGPDLSAIGERRDAVELFAHLLNPSAMTPGSTMPILPLTRAQAQSITIYLLTRQGDAAINDVRYRVEKEIETRSERDKEISPIAFLEPNLSRSASQSLLFFRYDGKQLYTSTGCSVCHRIGNEGGVVGPALTFIARARDGDWLRRYVSDPSSVRPDARMPQLYLNDREIDALVEFLLTLK